MPILYKIIAWLQDGKGEFDFALIKENFSFFPSKYQVRILKILFRLKVNKLLDFGADEIVSFAEITEEKKSKGGCVCLSVIIVLNSIKSYLHNHKFLLERDMFNLAFSNIGKNFKEWLSVSDFFDICEGKKYYSFPQNCSRCIFPILDKSGRRWYIIKFPFNENLISIVKQIPGRCYHPKFCVWFIPGEQKQSAINLAQRNSFWFISKDMPIYCIGQDINKILHNCNINDIKSDNIHLATLKMSDEKMPEPYFCDGRESQKEGYRNTWWCLGHKPCSACCVHLHDANSWENYTLLDFLHILGIDLEEYSGTSDFVYGNYLKFVSLIDRFNMLLSRLYCHECGELLYPTNSTYAYYSVTRFHCENENCSQYDEDIYLNHCLNSHCKSIIDSRESSTCTNGLYICPKCGTCCSNVMFNGQIERLKKAGGYISQDLKEKTENKLGHLEKKEYFCYHCGEPIKAEIRTLTERFGMLDTDCSKCHKHIHYVVWLNNYKSGLDKR